MAPDLLTCANCGAGLPQDLINVDTRDEPAGVSVCTVCGVVIRIRAFPSLVRQTSSQRSGEALLIDGESSCFYHASKKAEVVCESCGRFLCGLCDIELSGRHVCPICIDTGVDKGTLKTLTTRSTHYDSIALGLATIPALLQPLMWCIPFVLVTAPLSVVLAIWYWNAPCSILPRTKWRSVLAVAIGALQIVVLAFIVVFIVAAIVVETVNIE